MKIVKVGSIPFTVKVDREGVDKRTEVSAKLTARELLSFADNWSDPNWSSSNHAQVVEHVVNGNTGWAGGTYEQLFEPKINLAEFLQTKKLINQEQVFKRLKETMGQVVRRRRVRSAFDGEYDFDRKYDIEPFMNRGRIKTTGRIVNLRVHSGFPGFTPVRHIEKFSAMVSAIVETIEQGGVQVQLTIVKANDSITDQGRVDSIFEILIKPSDQFMSPQDMIHFLSANFYRRALFLMIMAGAQATGNDVADGLGNPVRHSKVWEIDEGASTVNIYSNPVTINREQFFDDLIKSLAHKG